MNPHPARRIDLATTPLRYSLKAARDAAATYNRLAGFATVSFGTPTRATIPQIVNGPIKNGDLDAIVTFLHQGLIYLDKNLEQSDVESLLGHYIRPGSKGGKGGKLLDFHAPIFQALLDNGVIEVEEEERADDVAPTVDGVGDVTGRPTLVTQTMGRGDDETL